MSRIEDGVPIELDETDEALLDALVRGPAYGALKRAVDKYRKHVFAKLLTSSEPTEVFRTQGIVVGLNTLENLPSMITGARAARQKRKEKEEQYRIQREKVKANISGKELK